MSTSQPPRLPKRDRSAPARPTAVRSTNGQSVEPSRSTSTQQSTNQSNNQSSNQPTNQSNNLPSPVTKSSIMPKIKTPECSPTKPNASPSRFSMSQPLSESNVIAPTNQQRHASHSLSSTKSDNQPTQPVKLSTNQSAESADDSSTLKDADPSDELVNQPASVTSPQSRVLVHQAAMLETLRELVRSHNVGHWKGLSTEQRKQVAINLCKEHLFNPQPSKASDSRTIVSWTATSSMIDYDIWVTCIKRTEPYYQGKVFLTTYTAHFNQSGTLVEFDEKRSETVKNCVVM